MMKVVAIYHFVAAVLAASAGIAGAATCFVAYGGAFTFRTSDITIKAGDTVSWTNAAGTRNVVGDTAGTPLCGCAGIGIAAWTNVFTDPGDYLYHCSFHQGLGMTGIVRVVSSASPVLTGVRIFTNGFVFIVTNTGVPHEYHPGFGRFDRYEQLDFPEDQYSRDQLF
jgi:plastocyanin